jgi:hypothetical protein
MGSNPNHSINNNIGVVNTMVNESIDLDIYVGTQKVTLFGREHEMHRLTTEEYLQMNYMDVQFQNDLKNIDMKVQQEIIERIKKIEAKKPKKERTTNFEDMPMPSDINPAQISREMFMEIVKNRQIDIQKFVAKIIPTLTKEEVSQVTINLFDAIQREIEIRIYMDKYYTRDEALELVKENEERNFRGQIQQIEQGMEHQVG